MSRQVFHAGGEPSVTSWANEGPGSSMAVAVHHSEFGAGRSVSVNSYLSKESARELARKLNAACDAIEMDEARARNLALPLADTEPTPC